MGRHTSDLTHIDHASLEQALHAHGVMGGARALGISYRQFQRRREELQIPRQRSYPIQYEILQVVEQEPGSTLRHLYTRINANRATPCFRQSIWSACHALVAQGLLRKTGTKYATQYWRVTEGGTDGPLSSVD